MQFVEHDRIPFSAEPLLGETLLVLAPHPDDEVIGCGGLIAQHTAERRRVHVIVITDGARGDGGDSAADQLETTRRRETDAGLRELGAPPAEFLGLPDREAAESIPAIRTALRARLLALAPDLVVLPSPIEIHPDHEAVARALIELLQEDLELAGPLALCRIAFMEISHPIRPNRIVDVTAVAAAKQRAIARHESQTSQRDYARYAAGLNQYRTMTLPPESRYAEAYFVTDAAWIRTHPLSEIEDAIRGARPPAPRDAVPVTVVVRTRNRPRLLRQALDSIRRSSATAPIVVVNDGDEPLADSLRDLDGVSVLDEGPPSGRSEAMNRGVRAATTEWIAFLDDDDLYYPEHLPVLTAAAAAGGARAYYTDAVSVRWELDENGAPRAGSRQRIYARPFDPDYLRFDNYIPLPTLLVRRADFLELGGFDPSFDLFEDWDFLIRLTARGELARIPRITCEIRHVEGSGSAMLGNPAGSAGFQEAKLRIWERHGVLGDPRAVERTFERMKGSEGELRSRLQDEIGRGRHLERDVARLTREKEILLEQLAEQHGVAAARLLELQAKTAEADALRGEMTRQAAELAQVHADRGRLDRRVGELEAALEKSSSTAADLYREIERLNALLNEIYGTRAWRLHRAVERIRGRR